jgi:hypothetical protein
MLQGQGSGNIDQHALGKKEEQVSLTFGQKLVGLNFNPSNDDKVGKAKQLCADLADLLHDEMYKGNGEVSELQSRLYSHTIGEILNAQMNVVKVITLKY